MNKALLKSGVAIALAVCTGCTTMKNVTQGQVYEGEITEVIPGKIVEYKDKTAGNATFLALTAGGALAGDYYGEEALGTIGGLVTAGLAKQAIDNRKGNTLEIEANEYVAIYNDKQGNQRIFKQIHAKDKKIFKVGDIVYINRSALKEDEMFLAPVSKQVNWDETTKLRRKNKAPIKTTLPSANNTYSAQNDPYAQRYTADEQRERNANPETRRKIKHIQTTSEQQATDLSALFD